MKRRDAILGIALLGVAGRAAAQQADKVARVGVLHAGSSKEAPSVQREPFERGLRELGWAPGSNVHIDYRYAEGDGARLPQLAAELVRSRIDVIVARGGQAIRAARNATATVSIVMSAIDDPVAEGLVQNLSRPGGNMTGIALIAFDLDGKRLELLKEAFPRLQRVAVIASPDNEPKGYKGRIAELRAGAGALKVSIELFELSGAGELPGAFASIERGKFDALMVRPDPLVMDPNRQQVVAIANKLRLPTMYWWRFYAEAGGLMSYGESIPGFHHRSASYVSRILKGANAGDLAIERPSKFELTVNLKTAKALGFEIPKAILFRADELIQ
jgi:putative tryptophan/tyrosine transport system substrate-binding protein